MSNGWKRIKLGDAVKVTLEELSVSSNFLLECPMFLGLAL